MEIKIDSDFSEWFGYWMGDGDRSLKRGTFGVASQSLDIHKLNMKILLDYFHLEKKRLRVEITTSRKAPDEDMRKEYSNLLELNISQIKTISRTPLANRDCIRLFVYSLITLRDFLKQVEEIKNKILISDRTIMSKFVSGIFAAEGSIRKKGKNIRMLMLKKNEVEFVRKILDKLGIVSTMNLQKNSGGWEISICSYENLAKFREIGGFGRMVEKNAILEERMTHYENKLPWAERYSRLCKIFSAQSQLTNKIVAEKFKMKYHNAKFMMATFAKLGLLNVSKINKIYVYTLNESADCDEIDIKSHIT